MARLRHLLCHMNINRIGTSSLRKVHDTCQCHANMQGIFLALNKFCEVIASTLIVCTHGLHDSTSITSTSLDDFANLLDIETTSIGASLQKSAGASAPMSVASLT